MNKIQIISVSSIIILSIALILFFKSDYYVEHKAKSKREEFLNKYDAVKVNYIKEGVYECKFRKSYFKKGVDKFGNIFTEEINLGQIRLEVSFTSDKLTIVNEEDDVIEEISFNGKYEVDKVSEAETNFLFYIEKWELKKYSTGIKIADIKNDRIKYLKFYFQKSREPEIWSDCGFRSSLYFKTKIQNDKGSKNKLVDLLNETPDILNGCPDENVVLHLNKSLIKYDIEFSRANPKYVEDAKYLPYIYDLENYK